MNKQEFEKMAIRGDGTISATLYETIERYYMSDNRYHEAHGGIEESKESFIKRVFGGKVNTPKTIMEKMAKESIKENRWCLQGNQSADKKRLDEMDAKIWEMTKWLAQQQN